MLLINLIFEFCVVIVQAGCTPRAWLPSDLATSPLVCNLYISDENVIQQAYYGFTFDVEATSDHGGCGSVTNSVLVYTR